jgi:mRNA interferase MazF
MMTRGEIWWAELEIPNGSSPGFRRPVLIVQANSFNESKISTVICCVITTNEILKNAPGNVFIDSKNSKLPKDSVVNVSQIITLDKSQLIEKVCKLKNDIISIVDKGILLVLGFEEARHIN